MIFQLADDGKFCTADWTLGLVGLELLLTLVHDEMGLQGGSAVGPVQTLAARESPALRDRFTGVAKQRYNLL